jgi:DNA-binding transcriptional LysR family regulator
MQIETFKVFCDLADSESFTKAAQINGITQSAVSQQVRALENRFGVMLIDRGRRHFALTAEGEAFLKASKEIVGIYDNLGDRLHELHDVVGGEVRVASIFSIGLHELPPVLKTFRQTYPQVEVHVEYRRSAQVYSLVVSGEVDLGLVSYPVKRVGLQVEPFTRDRLVVICPPDHHLSKKGSVVLEDVKGEKFIGFEPDLPTRKVLDRHMRERGVEVDTAMEFDNIETVKRAVEIENGISIVPEGTVKDEVDGGTLIAVPIRDPEMWRPLGIVLKRNRARSPALKKLIEMLRAQGGADFVPEPDVEV